VKLKLNECDFIPGRSTTDTTCIVRQLQKKYIGKSRKLYFVFIDLEKAFNRVPREMACSQIHE